MDCEKLNRCLEQYLDGTLDEVQAQEAENHLASCPDCACLVQMCKDLKTEEGDVPESFSSSWREQIRKEEKMENKQQKKKSFRSLVAVAAAFAFIVGGTLLTRNRPAVSATQEKGTSYTYSAAKNTSVNGAVMYKAPAMGASNDMIAVEESAPVMMRSMSTADTASATAEKQPMLIKRVDMTIKTMHFDTVVDRIQQLTGQMGGQVDYFSQYGDHTEDTMRNASLTLRIPADKLDSFVEKAEDVGNITSFSSYVEDAGDRYYDLAARLETQQKKMERLLALMEQATDVSDLIEVESSVADTQYLIDLYTGQMQGIEDDVAYSTVSVFVQETKVGETKEASLGERIGAGISDMASAGLRFLEDALIFVVSVLPWVAVVAVIVIIVVVICKKKKEK